MLKKTGIPTSEDCAAVLPSRERMARGPVAIVECFQQIPCNPCSTVCPRGAIASFTDINDRPQIDHDRCNGCAICVANCPGLAIFVVDESRRPDKALVKLPYERHPLPKQGDQVWLLNRAGEILGEGPVVQVQNPKSFDRTAVVHVEVPPAWAQEVRNIAVKGGKADA